MCVWEWIEWENLWVNNASVRCTHHFVKTEMSVFGDFRNVWVQRFPGSDLPAAWEEDVRANLAKHKQKVAVLREELEKEEFYVEYLEQLLIDVAKHKTRTVNEEEASNDDKDEEGSDRSNIKSVAKSVQNTGLEGCSETSGNNVCDNIDSAPKSAETITENSADPCVSELPAALPDVHSVSRSKSDVPSRNETSENKRPRCNTHPDISNYVTVIEVNGLNAAKREGMKEAVNDQKAASKKVPPAPPPKKFYNKRKSENSGSLNSVDRECDAGSQVEEIHEQNESELSQMPDVEHSECCPRTGSVESIDVEGKLEECLMHERSPLEDASSEDGGLPDDEEPYYDSVAGDGEYVYLHTGKCLRIELFSVY
jgi:breakpoint cluster region protein